MGRPKRNYKYLIGKRYGKLTVKCESEIRSKKGHICMTCLCECGNEKDIPVHHLTDRIVSCGCWKSGKERMFPTFMKHVEKTDTCWKWTAHINKAGYARHNHEYAHRLSYEYQKGKIPEGKMICHTCNNKSCVNPEHMYPGTAFDNAQDAIRDGTYKKRSLISKRWIKT